MNARIASRRSLLRRTFCVLACLVLFFGCSPRDRDLLQGYVEGEFVYVASPLAGALLSLNVRRGMQVTAGTPLFDHSL